MSSSFEHHLDSQSTLRNGLLVAGSCCSKVSANLLGISHQLLLPLFLCFSCFARKKIYLWFHPGSCCLPFCLEGDSAKYMCVFQTKHPSAGQYILYTCTAYLFQVRLMGVLI
jgi:hypothetical protein